MSLLSTLLVIGKLRATAYRCVLQEAGAWHVTLRPSHLLLNRTGRPLQLCIGSPAEPAAAVTLPPLLSEGAGCFGGALGGQAVMVAAPGQGPSNGAGPTSLRVWLGPGNGWSLPVLLGLPDAQVKASKQTSSMHYHVPVLQHYSILHCDEDRASETAGLIAQVRSQSLCVCVCVHHPVLL